MAIGTGKPRAGATDIEVGCRSCRPLGVGLHHGVLRDGEIAIDVQVRLYQRDRGFQGESVMGMGLVRGGCTSTRGARRRPPPKSSTPRGQSEHHPSRDARQTRPAGRASSAARWSLTVQGLCSRPHCKRATEPVTVAAAKARRFASNIIKHLRSELTGAPVCPSMDGSRAKSPRSGKKAGRASLV